jgi:uncharacterized membrane protein
LTRPSEARRSRLARTARGLGVASRILVAAVITAMAAFLFRIGFGTSGYSWLYFATAFGSFGVAALGLSTAVIAAVASDRRSAVWGAGAFVAAFIAVTILGEMPRF